MATSGMSEEDLEWFKSTFHPIPRPQLPDDCMQYSLYWIADPAQDGTGSDRARLANVQRAAADLVKRHLHDYIWQREPFKLEFAREDGYTLLRGQTGYGDSIEDEWVITWLLRELSRQFDELWIEVTDSDGQFLLVEASATLPDWLEPDIAANRVWMHKGGLMIIKPESNRRHTTEKLTLQDARRIIMTEPKRLMHSASIEKEAFYRLRNYPAQIPNNMHTARVTIPRVIAWLLHLKPAYISPTVEAFYLRDPISLKPLQAQSTNAASHLTFAPTDLVTVSVRFSRVGYAQLKSQDLAVPAVWRDAMPSASDDPTAYSRAETGLKVSCGFEMLVSDPQNQDKQAVREIKMLLGDLASGDEKLPTNEEIAEQWTQAEDDETWLDISLEDLDTELKGKASGTGKDKTKGSGAADAAGEPTAAGDFGDAAAQENLRRIVAQFEQFLKNDSAGLEGADIIDDFDTDTDEGDDDDDDEAGSGGKTKKSGIDDSDDDDDDEDYWDEEAFQRAMQEISGSAGHQSSHQVKTSSFTATRIEELSDSEDDLTPEDIEKLSKQFEAELRPSGVLTHSQTKQAIKGKSERKGKGKMVQGTTTTTTTTTSTTSDSEEGLDDEEINLARNLLESFSSQAGTAGPSSNLMGLMGMRFPQDDRHS